MFVMNVQPADILTQQLVISQAASQPASQSSLFQLQGPDSLRPARPPSPGLVLAGPHSVLPTVVVQLLFLKHSSQSVVVL